MEICNLINDTIIDIYYMENFTQIDTFTQAAEG